MDTESGEVITRLDTKHDPVSGQVATTVGSKVEMPPPQKKKKIWPNSWVTKKVFLFLKSYSYNFGGFLCEFITIFFATRIRPNDTQYTGLYIYCSVILSLQTRAGEPANFLAAPAPDFFFQAAPGSAPDFLPKRLRLLVFFFELLRLRLVKDAIYVILWFSYCLNISFHRTNTIRNLSIHPSI